MNIPDRYLGDGVYASYPDGYHIVLDLRGQDMTTKIGLEPVVLERLFDFAKDIHDLHDAHLKGKLDDTRHTESQPCTNSEGEDSTDGPE